LSTQKKVREGIRASMRYHQSVMRSS
jgi:hypothetical protein